MMKKKTTKAKTSFATALIAAMLAVLGMLTTPAVGSASTSEAAYPVSSFRLPYGASLLAGEITWYDRSVHITGSVKAVSTGKTAWFLGESPNCLVGPETRTASVGETRGFLVDIPCNYPGGITIVYVRMYDVQGNYLRGDICTRNGCVHQD
ncbi:hypothetical protein [Saccharothrix texasensis]|nr:hypothetical protein [Saccharothrix texasensis]